MRIYINRQPVVGPWGGGAHFINAYHKFTSEDRQLEIVTTAKIDVIFLVGLDNDGKNISAEQAISYKNSFNPDCKLILRVNENDARKGTSFVDDYLRKLSYHLDGTIFVSNWLKEYFSDWGCDKNTVIYNGVDQQIFKPARNKFNNGKINIVTHHWSDNQLKGADVYEAIDEFVGAHPDTFTFTYIGRTKSHFKHSKVIPPLSGASLGDELSKYDFYVSGSRWDPGPNHVLEALACDLPVYVHYQGGGGVEFAGNDRTFRTFEDLRTILEDFSVNRQLYNRQNPILSDWKTVIDQYNQFIKMVCDR